MRGTRKTASQLAEMIRERLGTSELCIAARIRSASSFKTVDPSRLGLSILGKIERPLTAQLKSGLLIEAA